jgi:TetR/AcrR family transcriptional regulator, transcriptional repressor for nem operon
MSFSPRSKSELPETKRKLVDAGVELMRVQGFNATSVDEICAAAGVTKGGFFHYFKSKGELAKAAVDRFREGKMHSLGEASYRTMKDPLDRVFGRLDFEKAGIEQSGGRPAKGCLVGMFAQEMVVKHQGFRDACEEFFSDVGGDLEKDLAEAKTLYAPKAAFDPKKVATFYLAMIQGSLILAKSSGSNEVRLDSIEQFRQYLAFLFGKARATDGGGRKRRPAAGRN